MVEIKYITLAPDEYNSVDLKGKMEHFQTVNIKLTGTNKCFVREIPGGVSKRTGKPYQAFKTYSILAEHNGKESYIKIPNGFLASEIEKFSVGDLISITCLPHPKGKTFVVEQANKNTEVTV